MTEEQILDYHCKRIEEAINFRVSYNTIYSRDDMQADIRAEIQEAMRKARAEVLRGN